MTRRSPGAVVAVVAVALIAGLVSPSPASSAPLASGRPAVPLGDVYESVPWEASGEAVPPQSATTPPPRLPKPGVYRLYAAEPGSGADAAPAGARDGWTPLGDTGIEVASAPGQGRVAVLAEVVSQASAAALGLAPVTLRLTGTDARRAEAGLLVRVPDAAYGADYATRASWAAGDAGPGVMLPGIGWGKPDLAAAQSTRDPNNQGSIVSVSLKTTAVLLSTTSGPIDAQGLGSFNATSLRPSGSWDVSAQTGTFAYSYPMRVPPAAAGPAPGVSLSYASQSVDGRTGATNNQASVVGDGWELGGSGFIERQYRSCSVDDAGGNGQPSSGDLCWAGQNAQVSFSGGNGALVPTGAGNEWRLEADGNTRFQLLSGASNGDDDGEYWKVTTPDGTQYFFGLNHLPGWSQPAQDTGSTFTEPVYGNDAGEPGHAAAFADSARTQAYRWNLDYIVDVHGNAAAFYYTQSTNHYRQNGSVDAAYTRSGELVRIEYGLRDGHAYDPNAASGQVLLSYADRCRDQGQPCDAAHPGNAPDVPWDLACEAGCSQLSPTFWSARRLSEVRTRVKTGGGYADVDVWALGHTLEPFSDGTSGALWLSSITHTGVANGGSIAEPPVRFSGIELVNRFYDASSAPFKGLLRNRIVRITSETGSDTWITYSEPSCGAAQGDAIINAAPQNNSYLCFAQKWRPQTTPPSPVRTDAFHKYVVTSVADFPYSVSGYGSPPVRTFYEYQGSPAWRLDPYSLDMPEDRTWSDYAGFGQVTVKAGLLEDAQTATRYTFFRGMNGDYLDVNGAGRRTAIVTASDGTAVADDRWLAGRAFETQTLNGAGGPVVSSTVTVPWASAPTAIDPANGRAARRVAVARATTRSQLWNSPGLAQTAQTLTGYDAYGRPIAVESSAPDAPTTCATTEWAPVNTAAWLLSLPQEAASFVGACADAGSADYRAASLSRARTSYDGQPYGSMPLRGDASLVEAAKDYASAAASSAVWLATAAIQYDALGRPVQVADQLGRVTQTAYTPADAGPLTKTVATNPMGWAAAAELDPAWGAVTSATDANGKVTFAGYDALGRATALWKPGNPKAVNPDRPNAAYEYWQSNTGPSWVRTRTATVSGSIDSYAISDGLGRTIQTQGPSSGGGVVATDTVYDSAGRVARQTQPYFLGGIVPSGILQIPSLSVPDTATAYDGLGRPTAAISRNHNLAEMWRTSYSYEGVDKTTVTPPPGGVRTATISTTFGKTASLTQLPGTGGAQTTTYGYDARGNMTSMTDPAGNHWTWGFDILGRQVSAIDPDAGTTSTVYDDAGRVIATTDGRGQSLAYAYDALDRKTGVFDTSLSGAQLSGWTYDTVAKGQLSSATSYVGSTPGAPGAAYTTSVNSYDDAYRATKQTVRIPSGPAGALAGDYVFEASYGISGFLQSQTMPAVGGLPAETLRYGRDNIDLPGGLASKQASYLGGVYRNHLNGLAQTSQAWGATVYSTYTYQQDTQRLVESVFQVSAAFNAVIADTVYAYKPAGQLSSAASVIDTGSHAAGPTTRATDAQCYGYDDLGRLAQAWTPGDGNCAAAPSQGSLGGPAPYWNSYATDAASGLRSSDTARTPSTSTTTSYSYPAAGAAQPHALASTARSGGASGSESYGYDGAGNATSWAGQSLTYDALGRVATVTGPSRSGSGTVSQSNVYDADGNLLLRVDSQDGATLFLGSTQLTAPTGGGAVSGVRTYSVEGIGAVAERTGTAGVAGSRLSFLVSDSQGTVSAKVDAATGQLTRRWQDPYGNPRGATDPRWADSARGFLDKPVSAGTGLTRLGAREYDPVLGRFLQVDPILAPANPSTHDGYGYAGSDPVNSSDPSGLISLGAALGKTAVGAAGIAAPSIGAALTGGGNPAPPSSLGSGLGGGSRMAAAVMPNYTDRHDAVVREASARIKAQAEALGFTNVRPQVEQRITSASKNCGPIVPTESCNDGYADIVLFAVNGEGQAVVFIWEVKSASSYTDAKARAEAQDYASFWNSDKNLSAKGYAYTGWDIGGPYKMNSNNDSYWGGNSGAVMYGDTGQKKIKDKVDGMKERGELQQFNPKKEPWSDWQQNKPGGTSKPQQNTPSLPKPWLPKLPWGPWPPLLPFVPSPPLAPVPILP